jgi:hypothetical protein
LKKEEAELIMKREHIQCFHLLEIFLSKRKTNHPMKILLKRNIPDYEDHPCFPTLITRKQLEKPCPPNSKEMRKYFQENSKKTRGKKMQNKYGTFALLPHVKICTTFTLFLACPPQFSRRHRQGRLKGFYRTAEEKEPRKMKI